MKSRLAILGMLVAGMLFSTTGAGLAISGLTTSNSASIAQYGGEQGDNGNNAQGGVEGQSGGGSGTDNPSGGNGSGLQPTQQVEVGASGGSGQLPFTGYAAIPILLGGIALLSMGLVIRHRARDES